MQAEEPAPKVSVAQNAPAIATRAVEPACAASTQGSPYIPVDSWVYPAVLRLYSMGYVDQVYLGMRPWTRASLSHALKDIDPVIEDANTYGDSTASEAQDIYTALRQYLNYDASKHCIARQDNEQVESLYSATRVLSGTPLRDSFHLGSTVINDYGRPYENGINNYSGASGYATAGRFLLYARGEFQGAPSAAGYSTTLAQTLSNIDQIPFINPLNGLPYNQATIPLGSIAATTNGRVLEAYVSTNLGKHIISFGKQDEWLGPGLGGSMAYSNNAENIYAFHINRIEPLDIPWLSRLTGPFRYEFLVGPLQGHTYVPNPAYAAAPSPNIPNVINPGNSWVHVEKFSFRPTQNLEFGFSRSVIWGGKGHEAITLHTFLKSFLSTNATEPTAKYTAQDPGARFSAFDFSYRLPFLRNWLTFYTDSIAHDAPSPIDKPNHACFRPGLYLSHLPGIPKLDLRVEGADTDSSYPSSIGGRYQYWEIMQPQGYTNQGQLFGDWIGRENKGGQGWITYHLSGNEWVQLAVRNQKASRDFIPGGTTLNALDFQLVKRVGKDFEINGKFSLERWKAPIYLPGTNTVANTTIQITWFPERRLHL